MMVEFEVLGRVRLCRAEGDAASPGGLQGLLLAMLLAHANRPVSVDRLVEAMWASSSDARAAHRLQMHVLRLRRTLGEDAEVTFEPGGYQLSLAPGALDAERFETAVDDARRASSEDPARAAELLRTALALWRGEPYEGFDAPEIRAEARRLLEAKLSATEDLYDAELRCGRHAVAANELPAFVEEHPLRERLHELLMISHALAGRRADALTTYRHARSVLVDELGIEPGSRLRELESRVLNGEDLTPATATPGTAATPTPAQLPIQPSGFTGRRDAFDQLDTLLDGESGSPRLLTLTGGAGVGKTALSVRWAHDAVHHFPDGQLYVDLRGYGPERPLEPAHVLSGFLGALGLNPESIPDDLHEKAALFRSKVAGRHLLIVLDNARGAAQVRPLLPGTATCATVVTSREVLAGLAVQEGARQVELSRMGEEEARQLLVHLLERGHDSDAIDGLMRACAGLPLALRVAAERLRTFGPADLPVSTEPAVEQVRRELLDGGDGESSVRSVLSWSYLQLSAEAAWVFRCLGVTPARELSIPALAAAADLDPGTTRRTLETLVRAHLVEASEVHRYRLHDVLGSYAVELAESDGPEVWARALGRLCDYYLETAAVASERIDRVPKRRYEVVDVREAELHRLFESKDTARRWLEAERENFALLAERAAQDGPLNFAADLAKVLFHYLDLSPPYEHSDRVLTAAATAARQLGDLDTEGFALRQLGMLSMRRDRLSEARDHLLAAIDLHQRSGDSRELADDRNVLSGVAMYSGRIPEAISHMEQAIAAYRELPGPGGLYAMANYGLLLRLVGRPDEARGWLETTLALSQEHGRAHSECTSLMHLMTVHRDLGEYRRALHYGDRALPLARDLGRRKNEPRILTVAGTVHHGLGEFDEAMRKHEQAMLIARDLGSDDVVATAYSGKGDVLRSLGDLDGARHHHQTALEFARYWSERSEALVGLGETHRLLGDDARAVEVWTEALALYEEVGHTGVRSLRSRIAQLAPDGAPWWSTLGLSHQRAAPGIGRKD